MATESSCSDDWFVFFFYENMKWKILFFWSFASIFFVLVNFVLFLTRQGDAEKKRRRVTRVAGRRWLTCSRWQIGVFTSSSVTKKKTKQKEKKKKSRKKSMSGNASVPADNKLFFFYFFFFEICVCVYGTDQNKKKTNKKKRCDFFFFLSFLLFRPDSFVRPRANVTKKNKQ